MAQNFLKLVLFAIVCFLAVEQSFRVYSVGAAKAFHPWKMNSLTSILNSGLIDLSDDPEIYYELKPNLDTWFKGARLRTNSAGLADREYSLEKPKDTLRIAVVGSSWSMATGVLLEDSYHGLLEERLNHNPDLMPVEIVNFAVEYYSLREIVGTVKSKVMDWNPDIIIVAVTFTTAQLIWDGVVANRQLPPKNNPFFTSYAMRALTGALGVEWTGPSDPKRAVTGLNGMGLMREQLQRSLREIAAATNPRGIKTVVLWMDFAELQRRLLDEVERSAKETGAIIARGDKPLLGTKREQELLRISRFDRHPNELAHSKIADVLESALMENNLLPAKVSL